MADVREVASGLRFPEGPVAMPDGSVLLVEIAGGTLSRVSPDGTVSVVAEPGGGPNGTAIGPDGAAYLCNNGGCFTWHDVMGLTVPGPFDASSYSGGRIERVDLDSGKVEVLYTECAGRPLRAPNDLVFDTSGGFWFTDHGIRDERTSDRTGIFYAAADGSSIREVIFPLDAPNGVGLSPDGDRLYAAETYMGRVWAWTLAGPGEVAEVDSMPGSPPGATLLAGLPGMQLLDSLGVDADGNVCVATLVNGGITVISPDGASVEHVAMPDLLVTNICWGGDGGRTAFITASGTGKLLATEWPCAGAPLAHEQT
ncbi:MAG TPA: SMP-30/gluconolactonase/LRE family protein [Acidimicrobiales bacterium]|nr:SMP-30/gluconolactonase/LRE family protein [Acidimicrobiales bacterium]